LKAAYVDSSCLIAIATAEPGHRELSKRLTSQERLFSSDLLEAELKSALSRHGDGGRVRNILSWVERVRPHRGLTEEIDRALETGYVRGADLWHLACALFIQPKIQNLSFFTLDGQQNGVAQALGFRVL
jgi:predicted nucleic acid-binding protein